MNAGPILVTEGLGKSFGGFRALNDVNVAFPEGGITAIIGPNGAGKSTFFNLISGAFPPSAGRILFRGDDMAGAAPHEYARRGIAKSFQITNVFPHLSAHENVRVAAQAKRVRFDLFRNRNAYPDLAAKADSLLGTVGLLDRGGRLARELAHGEQRALEIAMALASAPQLLLLDEPTAGMSPEETRAMMGLVERLATERTLILVEHKMKLVMGLCRRLVVLHQGELLAEGTPDDIRANADVRRRLSRQSGRMSATPLLAVEALDAWYGHSHVLQGVSLHVRRGEIVTLIGRNGAGKTTTLKSIMGLVPKRTGSVAFSGEEILGGPAHGRFHRGLAYVPEERRIVPGLTVEENLRLGILAGKGRKREAERIEAIAETFPRLKQRLKQDAITMSGGEQQMLAIARALMAEPIMVLLDEPSEGIMPILVEEMFEQFVHMKQAGTTILLVEQNVDLALDISDRVYVLDQGMVVHHGTATALRADPAIQERYCSV